MPDKITRDRIDPNKIDTTPIPRPSWIKVDQSRSETYAWLKTLMRRKELHTVCEEAHCPNMSECWGSGTATFLVLGDICTRACRFCDIKHGKPAEIDWKEPERVARAVQAMGLKHAVITSVNRDDCEDGGASIFAEIIQKIRAYQPGCSVEVLIPDFKGSLNALKIVMDARPEILNHNIETVPRLFQQIQPHDRYTWSQAILENAKCLEPEVLTKSGIMVGLGEAMEEIKAAMTDLRDWGVDILTIGQYLQPSRRHIAITRYYTLEEFDELRDYGYSLGFRWVESAPLVRSSYHAFEQVRSLSNMHKNMTVDEVGTI
jgi:lipoic acid synthetase